MRGRRVECNEKERLNECNEHATMHDILNETFDDGVRTRTPGEMSDNESPGSLTQSFLF